jgi:hypothetical protein
LTLTGLSMYVTDFGVGEGIDPNRYEGELTQHLMRGLTRMRGIDLHRIRRVLCRVADKTPVQ